MPNRRAKIDEDMLLSLWSRNLALQAIADKLSVSRGVVKRRLLELGVQLRTRSASANDWVSRLSSEGRRALTENARKARVLAITPEARAVLAKTRERTCGCATQEAKILAEQLKKYSPRLELAVGIYNIDVAFPGIGVAIELDGGNWHAGGKTRARDVLKETLLHSLGWIVLRYPNGVDIQKIQSDLDRIRPSPIAIA